MKDSLYTLLYAAVLGLVAAGLLTGGAHATRELYEQNKEAYEKRNILAVLGVPVEPGISSADLLKEYAANVVESKRGELQLYSSKDGLLHAVKFEGPGRNGRIEGFLCLDAELKTVRGITFSSHDETPGLGGEIDTQAFRRRFVGKLIQSPEGAAGIRIRRASAAGEAGVNEVDGITSATMTCTKVQAMLKAAIEKIIAERDPNGQ